MVSGGGVIVVGVENAHTFGRFRSQALDDRAARLKRKKGLKIRRQWERRTVDRRRNDGEFGDDLSLAIANHCSRRQDNLQARDVRVGDNCVLEKRRRNADLVAFGDARQVHGVGKLGQMTGLHVDADDELSIFDASCIRGRAIDVQFLFAGGRREQRRVTARVGANRQRPDTDIDISDGHAIHANDAAHD